MFILLTAMHIPQHCKGNRLLDFCGKTCNIYVVDDTCMLCFVNILCILPLIFIRKQNLNDFLTSGIL